MPKNKDTIVIKSRYGDIHKLERIGGEDSCLFLFIPASEYTRIGYNKDGSYAFIDPSGGPMIELGDYIKEADAIVDLIDWTVEQGYIIGFKKNDLFSNKATGVI